LINKGAQQWIVSGYLIWYAPPRHDAAADFDELVEVLARRCKPIGVCTSQQAVGLLADQI